MSGVAGTGGMMEHSFAEGAHSGHDMRPGTVETGWAAWIVFAGWMLMLLGFFHMLQGFTAIFNDEVYLVGKSGLVLSVDYTVWGWVHVVGGVIAILAGIAVQRGQMWARTVAVVVAFASAIVNMAFLPAYPIWSAILVALDVLIIWAVTVHGSVMKESPLTR